MATKSRELCQKFTALLCIGLTSGTPNETLALVNREMGEKGGGRVQTRSLGVTERLEGTTYSKTPRSRELSLVSVAKRRRRGYRLSLQARNADGTELPKKESSLMNFLKNSKGCKVEAGLALTNG